MKGWTMGYERGGRWGVKGWKIAYEGMGDWGVEGWKKGMKEWKIGV